MSNQRPAVWPRGPSKITVQLTADDRPSKKGRQPTTGQVGEIAFQSRSECDFSYQKAASMTKRRGVRASSTTKPGSAPAPFARQQSKTQKGSDALAFAPHLSLAVRYVSPTELIEYTNNSRTHSLEQIKQIAESIKAFGFVSSYHSQSRWRGNLWPWPPRSCKTPRSRTRSGGPS